MMSGPENAKELLRAGSELLLRLYGATRSTRDRRDRSRACGRRARRAHRRSPHRYAGAFQIGLNEVAIGMPVPVLAMELARDRLSKRRLTARRCSRKIYDPEERGCGRLSRRSRRRRPGARHARRRKQLASARSRRWRSARPRRASAAATIKYINAEMDADMRDLMMPSRIDFTEFAAKLTWTKSWGRASNQTCGSSLVLVLLTGVAAAHPPPETGLRRADRLARSIARSRSGRAGSGLAMASQVSRPMSRPARSARRSPTYETGGHIDAALGVDVTFPVPTSKVRMGPWVELRPDDVVGGLKSASPASRSTCSGTKASASSRTCRHGRCPT